MASLPWPSLLQQIPRLGHPACAGIPAISKRQILDPIFAGVNRSIRGERPRVVERESVNAPFADRSVAADKQLKLIGTVEVRVNCRFRLLLDQVRHRAQLILAACIGYGWPLQLATCDVATDVGA